ncbi:catalase [Chryseobacterium sp. CBo1]|uniref:catalase family protein n=1 Tax=Chryseobacterium sp. CBo1 TaxID=1869230 RepID=UPI0008104BD3|nr:catalase family protein [Chryseobacterium sp. CBo1]OCK51312.1 catalase [Chryseobacterium sp. CBo1]
MSDYIKYSYDLEEIPENFDQYIAKINKDIVDYIRNTPEISKISHHTRDAHANGYAVLKAEVEILGNLAPELAQGIYAKPGIYEAVVRFSNGSSRVLPDKLSGNAQGFALKIFGIEGKKLAPGEEDSPNVDFNLINNPVFFCNTAEHYVFISKLFLTINDFFERGALGKLEFSALWVTENKKAFPNFEALKELGALKTFEKIPSINSFLYEFYSMGAVRHGDYIAKVRIVPTEQTKNAITEKDVDIESEDWPYRKAIIKEIAKNELTFELQIQLCKDLKKMPINDLTEEWPQELSPFRTVAKITIPKQKVPENGNFEVMENLSFTPFRTIEENSPIGNLQRSRQSAYVTSSTTRHDLNHKKRKEPKNISEAFDSEFYKL